MDGEQKLGLVLDSGGDPVLIRQICERYGLSESEFEDWRDIARAGAAHALDRTAVPAGR